MCTCAALRVDVHGRDNFTNFGLHRLTFKAIMISSHLTKGIAEALLAIVTSALVSRRDRTDRTCTIGAAGHCPKADKNQKPLFAVRVQHVAQIQMVRTRGVQVCRRAIYLKIIYRLATCCQNHNRKRRPALPLEPSCGDCRKKLKIKQW